jgi:hypothetical protein
VTAPDHQPPSDDPPPDDPLAISGGDVMNRAPAVRTAATAGVAGSVLFAAGLIVEIPARHGPAHTAGELLILAGFAGFAAVIAALWLAGTGGGRFGQAALVIWLIGPVALFAGSITEAITGNQNNLFFPVGGLVTTLGGLLAAGPVARSGVLTGWRRWAAPALAAGYLLILVANIVSGDDWNQPLVMLAWPILAGLTGVAVLSEPSARHRVTASAQPATV